MTSVVTDDQYYTAKQLAGLPGLPSTESGVIRLAIRENWPYRKRNGRGGGREYAASSLPIETQRALRRQNEIATVQAATGEIIQKHKIQLIDYGICDWQKIRRDARVGLINALKQSMDNDQISLEMAFYRFERAAIDGGTECQEYKMLAVAKDGRGSHGEAKLPTIRSVQRWFAASDLTPKCRQKDMDIPDWADDFLDAYRRPQKPSVDAAYQEFCRHYVGNRPSIHQVRRFLDKLPAIVREKGRMGPRELKNIKPFVRRTFEELWPNDVWSADGHTFDAEVQHPLHGRPFRPEITTIIDIGTRKVIGFSVGLAESSLATVDALRHAVITHGVGAIFYVDNGAGYKNELLANEAIGLMGRCGITVKHSLPYNSQARGVIERVQKTLWVSLAKTLDSYMGADMDRQAKQLN
ncbi:MAG: transposase, partial [Methylobacter sp.]